MPGQVIVTGASVAADHARAMTPSLSGVLAGGDRTYAVDLNSVPTPAADWAESGAKELTGYAGGPALEARGHPAAAARAALVVLSALSEVSDLPGVELLGERAALAGLTRNAPRSCGGAMGFLRTTDGHLALSLARPSDVELVPAITQATVTADPWTTMTHWARSQSATVAAARCQRLGVPASPVLPAGHPSHAIPTPRPWLLAHRGGPRPAGPRRHKPPVVVDLTSLWAGPLCARLLRHTGAHVIKVESTGRPDGSRAGQPAFFERMNAGSEHVALDFASDDGRRQLRGLLKAADVVLEASRPRALRQLGIDASEAVRAGTVWLSITARGRDSDWVGFGDDVAAGAGLLAQADEPLPAGDALADPLAGLHAAVAVSAALTTGQGWLLDLSMHDTARLCVTPAAARPGGSS